MYPIDKYKFYTDDAVNPSRVYAISTYAGKTVRGTAKCDPRDSFSMEKGKELAAARCEERVAAKRLDRAFYKYQEALDLQCAAKNRVQRMAGYLHDAQDGLMNAQHNITELLEKM